MVTQYIWEIPGKILVFLILSLGLLLFARLELKDWSVGMEFHHILLLFNVPVVVSFTLKSLKSLG